MKLRVLCMLAVFFGFASAGFAAETAPKKAPATDGTSKQLSIPSVELGGYALDLSTTQPDDPNVPSFRDPANENRNSLVPYLGLHFSKPLGN